MADTLRVDIREDRGKMGNRRVRRGGHIPAILYGHGLENVCLSVPSEPLHAAVHHGHRLVNLAGAVNESAFIRELQWDTWGTHILHVDFTRISAEERVRVTVPIELRGEAPGVKAGGVIAHLLHEIEIECPAISIPDKLGVSVNHLQLDGAITVADLVLPKDATLFDEPDAIVVQCVVPVEAPEAEAVEAAPGEPEVIGEKKEEEES